ncbi:MAG TPA: lytic transglycosylase domain-containing protein [Thermoanaerobaculia bacterium]|nr:lytic transglycosylase domain-containing protein [Thermoanaerobaculia bacterium]
MVITLLLGTVAAPAVASGQFTARKILISNDATAIRATEGGGKGKTIVEVPVTKKPRVLRAVPASLAGIFEDAGRLYSLDPLLLAAVARQESRFQTRAVSPAGARGVMQLMPRTAASLGVTDSFDPRQNILGGAKYLRMLLDQFRGDVSLSLAAYNAGPGAVRKHGGIPPYRETKAYVAAITRDYEQAR